MILQNTVDPWSRLRCEPERAVALMGNRGVVHDRQRRIKPQTWRGRRWICCALEHKGIDRRPLFRTAPFRYSELFFLDEATAYAAGHRPCHDCRRPALALMLQLWAQVHASGRTGAPTAAEIDAKLHTERIDEKGQRRTFLAALADLPDGAMVAQGEQAFLLWRRELQLWTPTGYLPGAAISDGKFVVLTPPSIIQLLARGLPVDVHRSAFGAAVLPS